jgi:hypothetical protein
MSRLLAVFCARNWYAGANVEVVGCIANALVNVDHVRKMAALSSNR